MTSQADRRKTAEKSSSGPPVNKSTVQILKGLYAFTTEQQSFGVSEFATRLGITKNMAFRALATLLDEGFVVRDVTGKRYELGYRVLLFLGADREETDIRAICVKYMHILQEISRESVVFSIPMGPNLVTIDGVEPRRGRFLRVNWVPVPLHASLGSRAILASLHDDEIEEYIRISSPLKRLTPTTITDPAKLRAEVRLVRRKGYAIGYPNVRIDPPACGCCRRVEQGSFAAGCKSDFSFTANDLIEWLPHHEIHRLTGSSTFLSLSQQLINR